MFKSSEKGLNSVSGETGDISSQILHAKCKIYSGALYLLAYAI